MDLSFHAYDQLFTVDESERLAAWNANPIMRWVGVEFLEIADGQALGRVALQPHHLGGGGRATMNGAVIAALFDVMLGAALASVRIRTPQATLQLGVTYETGLEGAVGDIALCRTRVTRAGQTVGFVQGELTDASGKVCARADGVFRRFLQHPAK